MSIPVVYTVAEVAERLRVQRRKTVYDLLGRGKLQGFKVGAHWRVTSTALDAFMTPVSPTGPTTAPVVDPPADPLAFERLIPKTRVFSGARRPS